MDCEPNTPNGNLTSEETIYCQVCGMTGAGTYYHGKVCNSCRIFFYRSIRADIGSQCALQNKCSISFRQRRGNCRACRLRKCYEANMRPDEVGKKPHKDRTVRYFTKYEINGVMISIFNGTQSKGCRAQLHLKNIEQTLEYVKFIAGFDDCILMRNGPDPSTASPNTKMNLSEILLYPGACMDRNTAICSMLSDPQTTKNNFSMMKSVCRVTVATVELMSIIEEFHLLHQDDQLRLIQNYGLELPIYLLQYEKFKKGIEQDNAIILYFKRRVPEKLRINWNIYLAGVQSCCQKISTIMKEHHPDDKEMLLIRFISMFHPWPNLSQTGSAKVNQARMRLSGILGNYIRWTLSNLSDLEVQQRVANLLQMERFAKECMIGFNQFALLMVLHNYEDMNTPLGRDLYIKNL